MMQLLVNGLAKEVAATTVAELLTAQGIDPAIRFLAVAVNGAVVRRAEWTSRRLTAGDAIEIVRPLSGG
jgi:sulfur carrier protein